jgi:hypothetical protein
MTTSRTSIATPGRPHTATLLPGRYGRATRRTASILGAVVALAGLEHGIGEILQGSVAPAGIVILSWPDSDAFRILGGEPAMTILPNLLVTGILTIIVSLLFLCWATLFIERPNGGVVLMVLSVVLLLVGGGIGPPLIGLLLGLVATRIHTPVTWWSGEPAGVFSRLLARVWPWFLAADVAAWLALFPGVVLVAATFGADAVPEVVAYGLMLTAFVFLQLSLVSALASDA